jgi:enoyl-CoA hydratase/carnithine racemase
VRPGSELKFAISEWPPAISEDKRREEVMTTVTVEPHGKVALLRLTNRVTNAIGPALVADFSTALSHIATDFRGCVLAGGTKFFSIGLDLPALVQLNRQEMSRFWDAFDQAVLDLYCLPLPTAAAITGHAAAGGTILALSADYRFIAAGRKLMGLNEINIGLPVPFLAALLLGQVVSDRTARDLQYNGDLIHPETAKSVGLVDDIGPEEKIETLAIEAIEALADKPQKAFGLIKQNRTEAVCRQFEKRRSEKKEEMLSCWFQPAVQELLKKAAEKF